MQLTDMISDQRSYWVESTSRWINADAHILWLGEWCIRGVAEAFGVPVADRRNVDVVTLK
jgi:hypothetical protein